MDHVEVPAGNGKLKMRRCLSRVELAEVESVIQELVHINGNYLLMKANLEKELPATPKDGAAPERPFDPAKAKASVAAVDALGDLEAQFLRRCGPLFGRLHAELLRRAEGGTEILGRLELGELLTAAVEYCRVHRLTEEERKN